MADGAATAGRGGGREEEGGWGEGGGGERPRRFRRGAGVRGAAKGGMGWGKSFPMVGKLFSNRWKMGEKFFQSLENLRGEGRWTLWAQGAQGTDDHAVIPPVGERGAGEDHRKGQSLLPSIPFRVAGDKRISDIGGIMLPVLVVFWF